MKSIPAAARWRAVTFCAWLAPAAGRGTWRGRWGTCWPGSAGTRHTRCTGTGVDRAGSACHACQTCRWHTQLRCPLLLHQGPHPAHERSHWLKNGVVFFVCSCFPEPDHQDLGSRVRITLSYSNVHGMINSITEVPEVSVQLAGQQTRLHLGVWLYVQMWANGCTHYLLTKYWVNCMYRCGQMAAHTTFSPTIGWTVCTDVGKWLHTLPSHQILDEPPGFSWRTLIIKWFVPDDLLAEKSDCFLSVYKYKYTAILTIYKHNYTAYSHSI